MYVYESVYLWCHEFKPDRTVLIKYVHTLKCKQPIGAERCFFHWQVYIIMMPLETVCNFCYFSVKCSHNIFIFSIHNA